MTTHTLRNVLPSVEQTALMSFADRCRPSTFLVTILCVSLLTGCGSDDPEPADPDTPVTSAVPDDSSDDEPVTPQFPEISYPTPDAPLPDRPPEAPPTVTYRPSWKRPRFTDDTIRQAMLERFTAPGFELITDMGPEKSRPLLTLVQPLHRYHESYFGQLPPAQDGSDYAVTGYVMRDQTLFENAGMLPDGGLLAFHGRQIGPQFWMNDQPWDYYRRHLLLHEATHAFMRHIPGYAEDLPLWYLEGMAELLATHTIDAQGQPTFNIMPVDPVQFIGHERIAIVRRDGLENGIRTIEQITSAEARDFEKVETYAWCWALCRFLDSHPRYQERFRSIARELISQPFATNLAEQFRSDNDRLRVEWAAFAAGIEYGYDFERTAVDIPVGRPLADAAAVEVLSNRGWQTTGIAVQQGQTIDVSATGRFTLADVPKPWTSEANGISFRYYDGQPLGRLLATVITLQGGRAIVSRPIPLGNAAVMKAPASGTLYLRLNDHWGELADNRGAAQVTLHPR